MNLNLLRTLLPTLYIMSSLLQSFILIVISCSYIACHILVECRCIAKDDPLINSCDGAVIVIAEEGWYDFTNIVHPHCYGNEGHTTIHVANDIEGTGKVIDELRLHLGNSLSYDITPERMYVSSG